MPANAKHWRLFRSYGLTQLESYPVSKGWLTEHMGVEDPPLWQVILMRVEPRVTWGGGTQRWPTVCEGTTPVATPTNSGAVSVLHVDKV